MNKFLLAAATLAAFVPTFAQDAETEPVDYLNADYYLVGANINGEQKWDASEELKLEAKGDGVFEWSGEVLGTGFKINNGGWDTPALNLGAANEDDGIVLGTPYVLTPNTNKDEPNCNIPLGMVDGTYPSAIKNPKLVLTVKGEEVSIVLTGDPEGECGWYLAGDYNSWSLDNKDYMFKAVEGTDDFTLRVTFEEAGKFKVAWTGWGREFGGPNGEEDEQLVVGMGEDTVTLVSKGKDVMCYLIGTFDVTFTPKTGVISFVEVEDIAVEEIAVANGEATYFNLQGVRVNAPESGLYIKVANGKATKVMVRK